MPLAIIYCDKKYLYLMQPFQVYVQEIMTSELDTEGNGHLQPNAGEVYSIGFDHMLNGCDIKVDIRARYFKERGDSLNTRAKRIRRALAESIEKIVRDKIVKTTNKTTTIPNVGVSIYLADSTTIALPDECEPENMNVSMHIDDAIERADERTKSM